MIRTLVVCLLFAVSVKAGVSTAPVLLSDGFDTSNTVSNAPVGWKISAPEGTAVRVVDGGVTEPASAPFCVEMTDNSSTGRSEMSREFPATAAGRASAAFKLTANATAHAALQLRAASGKHLCSVIFAGPGVMRYDRDQGNVNTTLQWTPGQWQTVEIEWFADHTFSASLNGTAFAERVAFATNAPPARLHVICGYGTITDRIQYVDDVKVLGETGASSK
jgi:hypothetical protein